jgi:hypothetical protein
LLCYDLGMSIKHREPPATALAHGPTKAEDIERVREDVTAIEEHQAGRAASYWQLVRRRAKERRARRTR